MTEKIGRSLADSGKYEVTVIGFAPSEPALKIEGIKTISLGWFPRISFRRWLAPWRVLRHTNAVKPDLFIFSTYELLLTAIVLKVISNTRIIYDVRENYYRNIRHSEGLPGFARLPLALIVRLWEKLAAPAVDYFFLAERGYEKEFKFHRGGWTVIENKAVSVASRRVPVAGGGVHLLFTGTLSESTGVFRAIELAHRCHAQRSDVSLTIAGYAAAEPVRARIKKLAATHSFIRLVGIDQLVPHTQIIKLISTADAGIIANQRDPHTVNCVPTKLFEYLRASLPIITGSDWPWVSQYAAHAPFVLCDFEKPAAASILTALTTSSFYTTPVIDAGWESEAPKLLESLKNIV